jgi:putative DNA methylase
MRGQSMTERRQPLIEVAFPLEEVSEHSKREKTVAHGHISTLHIWWARRPLAACRAFIYASLVDDPETDRERDDLLKEDADRAGWDAVRKPDQVVRPREKGGTGLTGRQLLERARQRILDCNGGKPPRLLDPFAGGGAIPLEALRLGCEVEASDLNPVAVLILKCTVEYPQKYGRPNSREVPNYIREGSAGAQKRFFLSDLVVAYKDNPLAADVRFWGNRLLERAAADLAGLYPPDPDSSVPVVYLWSRTVPCPNCGGTIPLLRQYVLSRKRSITLKPIIVRELNEVDFEIVVGSTLPDEGGSSHGDVKCLLCQQVVKGEDVRRMSREGRMGLTLTAVVIEKEHGSKRVYRPDRPSDMDAYIKAERHLATMVQDSSGELSEIPDEPIAPETLGLRVDAFGVDTWSKLFNARQAVALGTLCRLVREAYSQMIAEGLESDYARAVCTYLAFAVDRVANGNSSLNTWQANSEAMAGTFARQALSMAWDYCESAPLSNGMGSMSNALDRIVDLIREFPRGEPAVVKMKDARQPSQASASLVLTDPPYYDAIDYAGLSDFFYVWLRRSLFELYPDELALPLTPKRAQAIMASETGDAEARNRYISIMRQAFLAMSKAANSGASFGIVFAHSDPDAWATLIEGLLAAGLVPRASWPMDTEHQSKASAVHQARLKTSVWMVCRPRQAEAREAFLGDVLEKMRPVIRERLLYFWSKGIRGADFFISAIGPALSVFGQHSRVLRPDGSEVTVRDFLDLVRKEATQVALEQVLMGADLGVVDRVTRQYVTWVWSYSRAPLDAGETIALCLATGADYHEVVRPGSIAVEVKEKSKKLVKLRTIRERGQKEEDLGLDSPARPAPLIDQLQRAAYLWGLNRPDELAAYRASLGETRWTALRTLGQAVAECLPDGDEDRRLINGLLGSNVMASAAPRAASGRPPATAGGPLPGFEEAMGTDA